MKKLAILMILLPVSGFADPLTAARTLPAGTVIEAEHIAVAPDSMVDLDGVIGMQTRTTIYEGKPIHPSRLASPQLVNRNQIVPISYETPLMTIQTEGRALEAGQVGQVIRVMNLSSKATVSGEVFADGTVRILEK